MSDRREVALQIKDFYHKAKIPLKLRVASGRTGFLKKLKVQIWGENELKKMENLSSRQGKDYIRKRLQNVSCLILAEGLLYPKIVKEEAKERRVALFVSEYSEEVCKERMKEVFSTFGSAQMTLSGGLLQIFGFGVLILGDSGVGKSESALELISRGHRFVCDDVVQIQKNAEGKLEGSALSLSRNFMEIRGLGIINIEKIFGTRSICSRTEIDLVIMLRRWEEGKEYDRLGLKFPESHDVLGVVIPKISIPVAPGRNMATLIEVACKVFLLKEKGYHAAEEISKKLDRVLSTR
jgi:HPr kinase/phosphorylase